MDKEKTLEIIKKLENVDIDVEATMENAFLGDCGDITLAVYPIVDNKYTPMRDYGDDFNDKILQDLENEGIYISLAYVQNEDVDNDIEFAISDLPSLHNQDIDELNFYEIRSNSTDKVFATDKYLPCDFTAEYGAKISKTTDGFKVQLGIHSGGPTCWSTPSMDFFENNPNDEWVDINNPLNQLLVEIMYDLIVFN